MYWTWQNVLKSFRQHVQSGYLNTSLMKPLCIQPTIHQPSSKKLLESFTESHSCNSSPPELHLLPLHVAILLSPSCPQATLLAILLPTPSLQYCFFLHCHKKTYMLGHAVFVWFIVCSQINLTHTHTLHTYIHTLQHTTDIVHCHHYQCWYSRTIAFVICTLGLLSHEV